MFAFSRLPWPCWHFNYCANATSIYGAELCANKIKIDGRLRLWQRFREIGFSFIFIFYCGCCCRLQGVFIKRGGEQLKVPEKCQRWRFCPQCFAQAPAGSLSCPSPYPGIHLHSADVQQGWGHHWLLSPDPPHRMSKPARAPVPPKVRHPGGDLSPGLKCSGSISHTRRGGPRLAP